MSDWIRHAIWWHVYPLGFTGAEPTSLPEDASAVPRLRQIQAWLPHLLELGCNGLALGPVFASGTHGYDTVDHLRVDRRLGTDEDLQALLDDCAAHGVRVLLDGVFNHVGRGFPQFRRVLAERPIAIPTADKPIRKAVTPAIPTAGNNSFAPALCGAKLLPPTIERLLPAT